MNLSKFLQIHILEFWTDLLKIILPEKKLVYLSNNLNVMSIINNNPLQLVFLNPLTLATLYAILRGHDYTQPLYVFVRPCHWQWWRLLRWQSRPSQITSHFLLIVFQGLLTLFTVLELNFPFQENSFIMWEVNKLCSDTKRGQKK